MNRYPLLALLCLLASAAIASDVYVVRHAEKQSGDDPDPGLTAAGLARARQLADLLASAGIRRVYSSNYRRTRLTAAPLALALGQDVELYDPRDLAGLAEVLRERDENALVVGHSNTTPALVRLLGGQAEEPMPEWQYDRLYLVDGDDESTETRILHLAPRSSAPDPP